MHLTTIITTLMVTIAGSISSSSVVVSASSSTFVNHTTAKELHWGTYRPNVYFGMKAREEETPLIGIMWHGVDSYEKVK
ncbi:hypothetical protein HDU76_007331, partial [Blyttiomyces sp. JEL0837]